MSMVRCDDCERLVDSDIDPDCIMDPPIPFGINYRRQINTLCKACRGEETPAAKVGRAVQAVFEAMDDLIILANQEATRSLVCDERRAIGQLMTRCEVLCSFALAAKPGPTLVRAS